jgi:predicted AlkP superfamily phosphohydrolase/phosphomutase
MTNVMSVAPMEPAASPRDGAGTRHGLVAIAAAIAPGALLGIHLMLLLFFLNPRLDLGVATVARAGVVLALAVGILVGAPLALALRGRPERLLSALPWGVTAAMALAAAAQWAHVALFAYYLPPGINVRLLKAAIGVSTFTVLCFYTALLHSMQRRRYGWRSRTVIATAALLSIVLTAERRWAFPRPQPPALELGMRTRPAQTNLAVIALEGATLDAILPLAEQGQLPFFSTLIRQGTYARLKTLSPPIRVAVWRSVATGAYPFRHGVVSDRTFAAPFLAPTGPSPVGAGGAPQLALMPWGSGFDRWARPLGVRTSDQPPGSRAPALWQILGGAGLATAVVGWPGTTDNDPRDASDGVLPDSFFEAPDLAERATTAEAERLRPSLRTLDPTVFAALGDAAPDGAKNAVIGDLWREAVARDLLARSDRGAPTAIFVGLPGLLEVSRGSFGGYAAVHFDGDSRTVQREAAQLVSGYYVSVDRLLGRLWASLPEPRLLAIVSGHGVREPTHWRRLISTVWPERSLAARIDGDADGVFMLLGDNLRSGERLDRSALVDVAPTLLYAMSQPVPRDGDGKVMAAAFGSSFLMRNPLTFVPSYAALR